MRGESMVIFVLGLTTFLIETESHECREEWGLSNSYEELCCIKKNLGKTFIKYKENEDTEVYTLCPDTKPKNRCPSSCSDILRRKPTSESGFYIITTPDGTEIEVYCEMDKENCLEGGWTRIANIDMTEQDTECPLGLVEGRYNDNYTRLCGNSFNIKEDKITCDKTVFDTFGISYSKVCGRVYGYQYGNGLAFPHGTYTNPRTDAYMTGVSINKHDRHVWTFASASSETVEFFGEGYCPCSEFGNMPPLYVDEHYTCESGRSNLEDDETLFLDDKLWDGLMCEEEEEPCCENSMLPWFVRDLDDSTRGDVELRLCGKKPICSDDGDVCIYCETPIELIELYIK